MLRFWPVWGLLVKITYSSHPNLVQGCGCGLWRYRLNFLQLGQSNLILALVVIYHVEVAAPRELLTKKFIPIVITVRQNYRPGKVFMPGQPVNWKWIKTMMKLTSSLLKGEEPCVWQLIVVPASLYAL
jgi:hypothetical protein